MLGFLILLSLVCSSSISIQVLAEIMPSLMNNDGPIIEGFV